MDHGPDSLAGITYNNLPSGRHILINWMGRWQYAENMAFNAWNGQTCIPRELNLVQAEGQWRLSSLPIREIESLRGKYPIGLENISIAKSFAFYFFNDKKKFLADIEMSMDLKQLASGDSFDIIFSGPKDQLTINFKDNVFTLDRSRAGKDIPNCFNETGQGNFDNPYDAPIKLNSSFGGLLEAPRVLKSPN